MKRNFKQLMVKHIPPISAKRSITSRLKKTTTYEVGNPGPVFEQTQKCGGVKPLNFNGTPTLNKLQDRTNILWN